MAKKTWIWFMNRKLDGAAGIVKEVLDKSILRHSGAGRNPAISEYWIPACAGMTA
ncbi:hypothetical protein [Thiolapillus sp.]